MRLFIVALVLVVLAVPSVGGAQTSSTVAYLPNPASARLNADVEALAVAQDTVKVDPYEIDNTVVYGAAVGGIIGGLAVAAHTLTDDDRELVAWAAAVAIPVIGGLIGAGVGYLIR